jgi:hypothetical protein
VDNNVRYMHTVKCVSSLESLDSENAERGYVTLVGWQVDMNDVYKMEINKLSSDSLFQNDPRKPSLAMLYTDDLWR